MDGKTPDTRQSRHSKKLCSTAQAAQETEPATKRILPRVVSKRVARIQLEPMTTNSQTPKLMEDVRTNDLEFGHLSLSDETEACPAEFLEDEITPLAMEENATDDEILGPSRTAVEGQIKSSANGANADLDKIAVPNVSWSRDSLQEAFSLLGRMRENIHDARRRSLDGAGIGVAEDR
ncbi:hypothetical protein BJ741DRAFT_292938 [Chytriomyces cf. hyalinus JEL632]|nr:hypothetical protein BJ741DRAFT_292938 [Chytriomyces cf. hyalinus JEL632]